MGWLQSLANTKGTPVAQMEDVTEEAVEAIVVWAEAMERELMPDGRPFGMERQSKEEEAEFYRLNIQGRPEAWVTWKDKRKGTLQEALSGVGAELASEVDLEGFVHGYALAYSAEMERILKASGDVYSNDEDAVSIPAYEEPGIETWQDL